jgi:hypothetical protein
MACHIHQSSHRYLPPELTALFNSYTRIPPTSTNTPHDGELHSRQALGVMGSVDKSVADNTTNTINDNAK